ncbi:Mur ligase family protein [Pseudoclavibacter sp. CFCC 11306]|uniref:Mur ligase family protein n=1 Tax=Pseudoclavibacter sp. CFCC 11306 TaxID=1564493 RepID=UPI0013012BF2|nr:UDP-N-acetylmuramoyl-L-alanyl-D-glutamate--2,6-diaminopimelate ligase [Pseudoclavibacter sp. CFCC 11306]KAB1658190.1 UDP-N-acetylmuramoyl-L-alanyl-D-glutamate--2,6-diaminopimelate ligase [Pseudoclavibacter sp. CFCC 11306]
MSSRTAPHIRPQHSADLTLAAVADLLGASVVTSAGEPAADAAAARVISGVTLTSSDVRPGDLYVGMPGQHTHGAKYAEEARRLGAVAVLTDEAGRSYVAASTAKDLPLLIVPDPRLVLGKVAEHIYANDTHRLPALGVTGTNGKTSTTYFMEALLGHAGVRTGLSTTVERHVGEHVLGSALTTPEASELHGLLASMRELGAKALLVEVSAQAVTRHRIDGVHFAVVGFTNLSPEHLDEYGDMEHYYAAKRALFTADRADRAVISLESEWGRRLARETELSVTTVGTGDECDWQLVEQSDRADGSTGTLVGPNGQRWPIVLSVPGVHMDVNAVLAVVMLVESGIIDAQQIESGLEAHVLADVYLPGRLERVSGESGPTFFVDYAHTEDALERTLVAVRKQTKGRIVLILGADGGRDPYKRPAMGRVASELSDVLVVNDINPRFEDPDAIRSVLVEAARAADHPAEIYDVGDPSAAIRTAIRIAHDDDTIIVCGPGDEDYHEVRGVKLPYSSRGAAREALREAGFEPNHSRRGGQDPADGVHADDLAAAERHDAESEKEQA